MFACYSPPTPAEGGEILTMPCTAPLDVVLLIDGSGSLGQKGWGAEIETAKMFAHAFSAGSTQAQISVILYSGPRTWSGVRKCTSATPDPTYDCSIETVSDFTQDFAGVEKKISDLSWPKGSTLTSLALAKAKSMLSLGRPDSKSVVVCITDGRPLSFRRTRLAAKGLRKSARLLWVPVTRYAPLSAIKKWATRRWQENVVVVKSFEDLDKGKEVVNNIIANICPVPPTPAPPPPGAY